MIDDVETLKQMQMDILMDDLQVIKKPKDQSQIENLIKSAARYRISQIKSEYIEDIKHPRGLQREVLLEEAQHLNFIIKRIKGIVGFDPDFVTMIDNYRFNPPPELVVYRKTSAQFTAGVEATFKFISKYIREAK